MNPQGGIQTITASDGTQLDAGVVNLARAIRQQESSGNYNAVGDAGTSHGAYQWQPGNFQSAAQKYGLNPNDFSPINQDKVAYHQILDYKNQGYTPEQIASLWNSGKPDPTGNVGTTTINGQQVHYDTPGYVNNVMNYFQQYKSQMNGGMQAGAMQPPQPQQYSVGGFAGNVVKSGANFLGNIGEAIAHPFQTAQTLVEIPTGGLQELGGQQNDNTQVFDAFTNYLKNRYGGAQNIANTIYNDPVGLLADLSTFFTGAGAVASGAGKVADIAKVGDVATAARSAADIANTAARYTNPLEPVIAGGKALASRAGSSGSSLGAQGVQFLTGEPATAAEALFKAGQEGGTTAEAAQAALRGAIAPNDIVDEAMSALKNIADQQSADYTASLEKISSIGDALPMKESLYKIQDALDAQLTKFGINVSKDGTLDFSRSSISDGADANKVQQAYSTIRSWGLQPGDRTPIGLDMLKRKLGNLFNSKTDGKPVGAFLTPLKQSVRQVLSQVPGYDEMTAKYSQTQDLIDELQKTYSLTGKANPDTVFRKLTSAFRSNDALRIQMLRVLGESGQNALEAKIAGATFSPYFARGIRGSLIEGGAVFAAMQGLLTPKFLAVALATSPRVMGEFIMALGGTSEQASKFSQILGLLKQLAPTGAVVHESQKILQPSAADTTQNTAQQTTTDSGTSQ